MAAGAGRSRPGEAVQFGAGIELHKTIGEYVNKGEVLATLHTDTDERFARAKEAIAGAWSIEQGHAFERGSLILERIS